MIDLELRERIAQAMFRQQGYPYIWEMSTADHRDIFYRFAEAAIIEMQAVINIKRVFPDAELLEG